MYARAVQVGVFLEGGATPAECFVGVLETDHLPAVGENLIVERHGESTTGYRVTGVGTVLTSSPSVDNPSLSTLHTPRYQVTVVPTAVVLPSNSAWQ